MMKNWMKQVRCMHTFRLVFLIGSLQTLLHLEELAAQKEIASIKQLNHVFYVNY